MKGDWATSTTAPRSNNDGQSVYNNNKGVKRKKKKKREKEGRKRRASREKERQRKREEGGRGGIGFSVGGNYSEEGGAVVPYLQYE